jgi:NADPH:quinone reductase-like Zn-dependent oxidoreductase
VTVANRAFYPAALIVVASYYVLFAAISGSIQTVVFESIVMTLFVIAAVAGFKGSAWIIVGGLACHGFQDAVHGHTSRTLECPPGSRHGVLDASRCGRRGSNRMKAIVRETYGSPEVLHLEEVPVPTLRDDDVLVRVRAASANAGDWHLLRGTPFPFRLVAGLRTPRFKIIGTDVAGHVEAVGRNVTRFRPGDEVFGELSRCGFGAYAEFAAAPEKALALKPANLSFEEAATLPTAGCTALQGLRKGQIERAQRVLINGASGGVGTFAVQIAKTFATEVTAVCSTRNVDMVRSTGADHVIDYTKDDFATRGQRYDLILAANGDRSIWDDRRVLTPDGCYAMTGGSNRQLTDALVFGPLLSIGRQQFGNVLMKPNQADLLVLKELCEAGKVRPVIDRRFPLSEVSSAVRYVEDGHARGKVVVTV